LVSRVSPRVGVQVDETEDEGVHEKRDTSRGGRCQKVWIKQGPDWPGLALT
jgi:hypothetical protein